MSFLADAARYLADRHPVEDWQHLRVILPNRRAVSTFRRELARLSSRPFLAPAVSAVDDFVMEKTGRCETEPVSVLFTLYDVFSQYEPDLDFERFSGWGPVVLRDFDQIDLHLASPRAVFSWVEAERAIERWQLQPDWQPASENAPTSRYFRLFSNLQQVYEAFRQRLEADGRAYRGLAYRLLAEDTYARLLEPDSQTFYYFLGFNALSAAEQRIISELVRAGRAETLWDTDAYYLQKHHEAGLFLRKYLEDEGSMGAGEWNRRLRREPPNRLLTEPRDVRVVGAASVTLQAKVAGEVLRQWMLLDDPAQRPATAVVLADEALLLPMLFSLEDHLTEDDYNVTMGVSLRNSTLYTLLNAWFELQRNVVEIRVKEGEQSRKVPKYSHRHLLKIINHPFVRRYDARHYPPEQEQNPYRTLFRRLVQENWLFLEDRELLEMGQGDPLFAILFTRWPDDATRVMGAFYRLVEVLRPLYADTTDALETEYLYEFYTFLKRLERVLGQRQHPIRMRTFRRILTELFRQTTIPFTGDSSASIQIMGMLETRCLDFERVILLSANEGTLPVGRKHNSLIPYEAAREFGLPTHREADAVVSYHFFRLLQRAREVVLVHTIPAGEGKKAEKSRYLLQIEHELARFNPNLRLRFPSLVVETPEARKEGVELVVPKSGEVLQHLTTRLNERGIYATHLNQYYTCSMQFYLMQVAGIREEEETSETLAAHDFGTWLHRTLEAFDEQKLSYGSRLFGPADYELFLRELPVMLRTTFAEEFPGQRLDEGRNLILFNVARKLLETFFQQQKTALENGDQSPYELVATEHKLHATFQHKGREIRVAGTIDRLEREGRTLRVIDYKTGKADPRHIDTQLTLTDANWPDVFMTNGDWKIMRQLWLYKYLVIRNIATENDLVVPGVVSFRDLKQGFMAQQALHFEENETHTSFLRHTEMLLGRFVDELLDPARPFVKTDDLTACEHCPYARICSR